MRDGATKVLVPSVGLCVHPYLFAYAGLEVVATRLDVLEKWARILAPGGLLFWCMHNDAGPSAADFFEERGWRAVDALRGESAPGLRMVQSVHTSG